MIRVGLPLDEVIHGDCLEVLKELPDNCVDSVVTDPPYELGFMGKSWDRSGIAYNVGMWGEVLRVLKPGGHLLAFGGARTYHRMACAVEDAGFEIRDMIEWIYGSGFPKSLNISKAIDREFGKLEEREIIRKKWDSPDFLDEQYIKQGSMMLTLQKSKRKEIYETAPATAEARRWDGWGTGLKPAHEPVVVARKPLSERNVALNVLKWGTGGLNIDACRIKVDLNKEGSNAKRINKTYKGKSAIFNNANKPTTFDGYAKGRFPANLVLDEEAAKLLDEQSGVLKGDRNRKTPKLSGWREKYVGGSKRADIIGVFYPDSGGASRFFYCAKASKSERNAGLDDFEDKAHPWVQHRIEFHGGKISEAQKRFACKPSKNNHPTVKPVKLMRWLVRLVTPPNGVVLDPFMGSGSTGIAAVLEGFHFIGIEKEEEYVRIARARIDYWRKKKKEEDEKMKGQKKLTEVIE